MLIRHSRNPTAGTNYISYLSTLSRIEASLCSYRMDLYKMRVKISCICAWVCVIFFFTRESRMWAYGGCLKNNISLYLQSVYLCRPAGPFRLWYNIVHGPASAQNVCVCNRHSEGVAGESDSLRSSPEKKKYIKRVGSLIVEHFTPQRPGDGVHRHIIGSVVVLSWYDDVVRHKKEPFAHKAINIYFEGLPTPLKLLAYNIIALT